MSYQALKYLTDKELIEYKNNYDFEEAFYKYIAMNQPFKIIPIPMPNGTQLSDEDKQDIVISALEEKAAILYQAALDDTVSVVFGLYDGPVGLIYSLPVGEKYHG